MSKIFFTIGFIMIVIVTIGTFCQNDIIYWYTHTFNEKKYQGAISNKYFLEDNFSYVNNYTDNNVSNKKQLVDLIYYFINSGADKIEAYCTNEYSDCIKDLESISTDQESLSIFNNFVHPYNSFSKLSFSYDEYGNFTITNNKIYDEKMIVEINNVVNKYINDNISTSLNDAEKLKLIHDFIIDNTKYDKLKVDNINDETYNSENAYGVLLEHYGICSGYADTMAIFLNKLGIINYKISNDEHIWNLAYIDNKWVHIDLTWDDPVTENDINRTDYFMIDTKTLQSLDNEHDFDTNIFTEAN